MAEELTYYDKKYDRGWYRNGKRYRFLYIVAIGNVAKYQTKTAYLRNWETMSCENLVVLAYLAVSIFINERGFTIFKVMNNLVGVGFYGVLVYFTSKPSLVELIGMVALLSCVLIPVKLLFYKKISNKISDRLIYD